MHIGFVCNEFTPTSHGGTGSSYRDLAHGLAASGHRVTVVGVYRPVALRELPPDAPVPNLRVERLAHWPVWLGCRFQMLADRWRLKRWLERTHRSLPFDVIECSDYGGWLSSGGPDRVATIVRIRGSNLFFDHELNRPGAVLDHELERRCLRRATALCAVSHYAARRTLDLCGEPSRPVTVIYNAVDPELFSPAATIATEPGLIVFVNTVGPRKGIGQLLEAMNHVCSSHPMARLVAIGRETRKGTAGKSYAEELLHRVLPEFRSRVLFTGRLSRDGGVLDYLRKAHVCCYPSHMETFGIAPVEAMSVGKPTIYSRTGPGAEILEHGVSGLLCDPLNPKDIAEKILTVLNNPTLAASLGENARRRVLERFNQKDWIRRNLAFFQGVLPQRT